MDSAHQAELERILNRRKAGNRMLGAGGTEGAPPPLTTTTTNINPNAAAGFYGTVPSYSDAGRESPPDLIPSSGIISNSNNNIYRPIPGAATVATSSLTAAASRPPATAAAAAAGSAVTAASAIPQNSIPLKSNADLSAILDELQRQGRAQQMQMRALQDGIDQMAAKQQQVLQNTNSIAAATTASPNRNNANSANNASGSVGVASPINNNTMNSSNSTSNYGSKASSSGVVPPPAGMIGSRPGNMISGGASASAPDNNRSSDSKKMPTFLGAYDLHRARVDTEGLPPSSLDPGQQKQLADAAAMGLFVKPRSFVTTNGSRMVTFNTPSTNQLGHQPTVNKNMFGNSSPSRRINNNNPNNIGGGGTSPRRAAGMSPGASSRGVPVASGNALEDDGELLLIQQQQQQQQQRMKVPKAPKHAPVVRPFSYSTFDVNSARVLLATGDWMYKLRVQVNPQSITGPAGWNIMNCVPRFVYLNTETCILMWGDSPGGWATIASRYVPIDHIVNVQIFSSTEAKAAGGQVVVYYLALTVVEGGFAARGRAAAQRLCVFATEVRDKADMWFEALQTISNFYRSQGAASVVTNLAYSSD